MQEDLNCLLEAVEKMFTAFENMDCNPVAAALRVGECEFFARRVRANLAGAEKTFPLPVEVGFHVFENEMELTEAGKVSAEKKKRAKAAQPVEPQPVEPVEPVEPEPVEGQPEKVATLAEIRALLVDKVEAHQAAIFAELQKTGARNLTTLSSGNYGTFYAFLKGLS